MNERGPAPVETADVTSVLVVDDDPSVRAVLTALLEADGLEVRAVEDGHAALRALRLQRPDCVLLDARMPGLSGLDVLALIRSADGGLDLPVVMLTGDDGAAWDAWTSGVDLFVTKPFEPAELLRCVGELCRTGRVPV